MVLEAAKVAGCFYEFAWKIRRKPQKTRTLDIV
jgi:hypothetical protein